MLEDIVSLAQELDNDGRQIDAEFNGNSTRHHSNTMHCRVQDYCNASQPSTTSLVIAWSKMGVAAKGSILHVL